MDNLRNLIERQPISEMPGSSSNQSANSVARLKAIAALIQQTRTLSGLPFLSPEELRIAVPTWTTVLQEVPDQFLKLAWEKATAGHDWTRNFPVHAIPSAYRQVLREDAERIENERRRARWTGDPDLFHCWKCEDTGYQHLEIYCRSRKHKIRQSRPCNCEMTPIAQRSQFVVGEPAYTKNEMGLWQIKHEEDSLPCRCSFCDRQPRKPPVSTRWNFEEESE